MAVVVMAAGWQTKVQAHATRAVNRATDAVARDLRRNLAEHVDTGALLRSVKVRKTKFGSDRIYIGTDHWQHIEYGTRPHRIEPRTKKALHWPTAAHPVAAVSHPGTPAYAPIRRALFQKRRL